MDAPLLILTLLNAHNLSPGKSIRLREFQVFTCKDSYYTEQKNNKNLHDVSFSPDIQNSEVLKLKEFLYSKTHGTRQNHAEVKK